MIKSMTGYGLNEQKFNFGSIRAEIRSVNHKYFDVNSKLPNGLDAFEPKVKELIRKSLSRGRIGISIFFERDKASGRKIIIDEGLAKKYKKLLLDLKKSLGLKGEVTLEQIVALPDVLKFESQAEDYSKYWNPLALVISGALKKLVEMRKREGRFLHKDLSSRALTIDQSLSKIKKRLPKVVELYRKRLIKSLGVAKVPKEDRDRLEKDVALFAKNSDISEEVTRVGAHIDNFGKTLSSKDEAGRVLDFIAQELYREANTMGAKASDYEIQQEVIEIKGEIEKIREQVLNVE